MKFKQVMGFIYLFIFLGLMAYKFEDAISGKEDAGLLIALAIIVILFLLLAIRKVIVDG
ncbi:MAG: hypothetical protein AAGG75_00995 [Bacteroidota bacterium]